MRHEGIEMTRPLALTLGEPAGIGPEITLAAWCRRDELDLPPFYILADPDILARRAAQLGLDVPIAVVEPEDAARAFAHALPVVDARRARSAPSPATRRLERAGRDRLDPPRRRDVFAGRAHAVVTNPIAKEVLYRSGFAEPGHTEYLARLAAGA